MASPPGTFRTMPPTSSFGASALPSMQNTASFNGSAFPTMQNTASFDNSTFPSFGIPPTASQASLPHLPPPGPPSAPISQSPSGTSVHLSPSLANTHSVVSIPPQTLQAPPTISTLPLGSGWPQQAHPIQAYPVQAYPVHNLPVQEPWYSAPKEDPLPQEPQEPSKDEAFKAGSTDYAFLFFGLFAAILVSIIPIWDGISLLGDPVWVYMCGKVLPIALISAVAVVVVFFFIVMDTLLLSKVARTARTEQTLLNVVILFILLLGTIFVTMSTPIKGNALIAQSELMYNCKTGLLSQPLYQAYQDLQAIRNKPSCVGNVSVETCDGYTDSHLNSIIKGMEQRMQCSGFCFFPKVSSANATVAPANSPNASYGYPVALFSKAGMQGSCSSMAARDMAGFAQDMGTRLEWEGYFLMAAAVVQGFLLVGGSCVKHELAQRRADGYGTMK